MSEHRVHRVLVVTDHAEPTAALLAAISERADFSPAQFRVVVPNPARAELHLLHPERHDKAAEAEQVLRKAMPALEAAARGPVVGSVSVQHDPMDAIEHTLAAEPVDEILLAVHESGFAVRFHQDLPHRLSHHLIPVRLVSAPNGEIEPA